jgi:hypothetical protein
MKQYKKTVNTSTQFFLTFILCIFYPVCTNNQQMHLWTVLLLHSTPLHKKAVFLFHRFHPVVLINMYLLIDSLTQHIIFASVKQRLHVSTACSHLQAFCI